MEEGWLSSTAILTAMLRAAHLFWDDFPKVFEDTFAMPLSGCANENALRENLDARSAELAVKAGAVLAQASLTLLRSQVVGRSRYVEDELAQAINRGVSQYVILGAGLDSFAYRRPDLENVLRVFEVDHPATQAWKRSRLHDLGVASPSNLHFVALDFEHQSLIESLRSCGYHSDSPGFFSWLGVTQYLTRESIFETLRIVASMAPGTEIVFTYLLPNMLLDDERRQIRQLLMNFAGGRGEPMLTFFELTELADQVRKVGFTEVWNVGPEDGNARYFANRTDGLRSANDYIRARV